MDASVIIPAHRAEATLPETLRSVEAARAAFSGESEIVVVEDPDGHGPSWARNRGLDRARGEYVFFCDADDLARPDFLSRPVAALAESGADLCFFGYEGGPDFPAALDDGADAVCARYLPAFFGYSMDDVRRWNRGGELAARKQPGQVWRCAFRRSFLERHALRFDERMTFFEDAAFLSACAAFAEKAVSIPDRLYVYRPRPDGNLATGWRGERNWDYKFLALDFRRRLDERCGGSLWRYCEASCVFSALELLKARHRWREYIADGRVKEALADFPLSARHPLVAAAVAFLRLAAPRAPGEGEGA